MCLHHEGSMIGVQCQLMICRGHIRVSKGTFQKKIAVDSSMEKLMFKSKFSLCLHFSCHLTGL